MTMTAISFFFLLFFMRVALGGSWAVLLCYATSTIVTNFLLLDHRGQIITLMNWIAELHNSIQAFQLILYRLLNPLWSALCFWPLFYIKLFGPFSTGRSIFDILRDPGIRDPQTKYDLRRRKVHGRKSEKAMQCRVDSMLLHPQELQPTHENLYLHSSYQVGGAYSYLSGALHQEVIDSLRAALDTSRLLDVYNDPLRLQVPYEYLAKQLKKPPRCHCHCCNDFENDADFFSDVGKNDFKLDTRDTTLLDEFVEAWGDAKYGGSSSSERSSPEPPNDPMKMEFHRRGCTCNNNRCCEGKTPTSLPDDNRCEESPLTLTVTSLTRSWSVDIVVNSSHTIQSLKKLIASHLSANPADLRLHINSTSLDDADASISSYIPSSSSGAVIIVALPLKAAAGRKKRSKDDLLAEAAALRSERQASQVAAVNKKINAKAKKPGRHPTTRLLHNFTPQQFNTYYEELLAMAKEVSDDTKTQCPNSGKHVPIYSILQKESIRTIIFQIMAKSNRNFNALRFNSLETIIQFFATNGVDITKFCDDLQARYHEDIRLSGVCKFLKRILLYTIRCEQGCCGKCGSAIDNLLYGAVGFESNHVADDNAESDDERIKCFNADIHAFDGDLVDALFELCKTRLECWKCHNHFGACNYDELPDTCVGNYDFEAVPCFVAQETVQCRNALACIKDLIHNATSRPFKYICTTFESNTVFHFQDCFLFNKERWNAASRSTRERMLRRVYLQVEKRVCGCCLHCEEKFCNLPARELGGIDLHHVIDAKKLFNPSEGVDKTLDESLKENRKLVPLCKKCHLLIHHKAGENERFMDKLKSKYGVDASLVDGELSRIPS